MESWKTITYNVAVYMFFFEIRPLETYLTAYLTGPDGNVSLSELGMAGISATSNTYILGFSYLYSQISDRQQYQKATSIVSVSLQLGIFCGSVFSQIIFSTTGGIYTILPYCNASAMFLSVISACLFPTKIRHSFRMVNVLNENSKLLETGLKNKTETREKNIVAMQSIKYNIAMENNLKGLLLNFKTSYSDTVVLKRSILYIISMGSHFQILTNMNVLYSYTISKPGNHDVLLNGYAEAMISLCGAMGAYIIGKLRLDWNYYGDAITAVCSSIMGILMMSCYFYDHLCFIYLSYILYGIVSQMVFVSNCSEIAKRLKNNCYSLVYGFNLLGSLLISTFMTIFLVQINFLDITIPGRFLFIGGLDVCLGVGFFFLSYLRLIKIRR
ncbi:folate transporter 1-like isoform X2 [Rhopalosiphum padi]|uniref:folate transporter 1-like isoform X2 n=1 Tax=Rhopalosiphum padi TaxID=40932 RepID=UPI00298E7914|nr:folate transporter 1-like isoform X2 [Rhopalosiphum padi]